VKRLYSIPYKYSERIYYAVILVALLPPLFIFSPMFTTYRVGGFILVVLLLLFLWLKKMFPVHTLLEKLVLILFIAQSLSILSANNGEAFINAYENICYGLVFFFVSSVVITKKNTDTILSLLVITAGITLFLRLCIFLDIFTWIGNFVIHPGYMEIVMMNVGRGRVFIDSYEETILPLCLYFIAEKKYIKTNSFLIIGIAIMSVLSGFRTKVLMFLLSIILPLFFLGKVRKLTVILLVCTTIIFSFLYMTNSIGGGISLIERLHTDVDDITTGRATRVQEGMLMGMSSPFIGVGLGNYFDNIPFSMQKSFSLFNQKREELALAAPDPHNIFISLFAETGIVGLGSFLFLLTYFLYKDISLLRKKGYEKVKIVSVSFWVLFSYSLANPSGSISYITLFWLFRVVIEKNAPSR
jgi:O-antigen ligase